MNRFQPKVTIEFDDKESADFFQLLHSLGKILDNLKSTGPAEKPFLNIDEASAYLSIPKNTLYQYTSQRKIPFAKAGKLLIFDVKELNLWVQSLKKEVL